MGLSQPLLNGVKPQQRWVQVYESTIWLISTQGWGTLLRALRKRRTNGSPPGRTVRSRQGRKEWSGVGCGCFAGVACIMRASPTVANMFGCTLDKYPVSLYVTTLGPARCSSFRVPTHHKPAPLQVLGDRKRTVVSCAVRSPSSRP